MAVHASSHGLPPVCAAVFLVACLVGAGAGESFLQVIGGGLRACLNCSALSEGSGRLPSIGDADDGYVLDLGQGPPGIKDLYVSAPFCSTALISRECRWVQRVGPLASWA